jgi:hypothetical protein
MDDFVLPIRRRPNTTSLRDRFLGRSDSQPNVQTQRQRQARTTHSQVPHLDYFNSDFDTLKDRTVDLTEFDLQTTRKGGAMTRFEERLRSLEEQQQSSLLGKKFSLSEYKEKKLRPLNLQQIPQVQQTHSQPHTQVPPVLPTTVQQIKKPNLEDTQKLNLFSMEERQRAQEYMPDIPMDLQTKATMVELLKQIHLPLRNVSKAIVNWFAITHDGTRARAFFRAVRFAPILFLTVKY